MKQKAGRLLPHEIAFGLFMVVTWARLAGLGGWLDRDALVYLPLIVAAGALVAWCERNPTSWRWRIRLAFYPVAMVVLFSHLKTVVPRFGDWRADSLLQETDRWLLGGTPSLRFEPLTHPALTELFCFCYHLVFFPYVVFSLVYYLRAELPLAKRLYSGLFTVYGLGFLGYTFLPATGPYVAMAGRFTVPLEGWWFTELNNVLNAAGSNGADVFPSLHCAISAYLLFFDRRHRPWRFTRYLLPCVAMWVSTLYLRYHYAVDCLAGFALAGVALWIVRIGVERRTADVPALAAELPETTESAG
jgi:hypothetical protein